MIRLDAVTLKQLRALQAVSVHGSLTAAAAAIGQTTPAIHSQIRNLEVAIGAPLLVRSADRMRMEATAAGEEMLRAGRQIESILSHAADQIMARSTGKIGHVRLSAVSTAMYFAPRLVKMLQERCPEIDLSLHVSNRQVVIETLQNLRCDLAIMGRPPRDIMGETEPLGPHPHGVILPPDHPLAGSNGYDPALLVRETFLSREPGSGTRVLMQRFLDRLGEAHPRKIIEMDSNETIKQGVLAGLGVAFLSYHTVDDEVRAGRLATLTGPYLPVMRHWYLVTPRTLEQGHASARIAAEITALNGVYLPKVMGEGG